MRSKQVDNYDAAGAHRYSELQVMHSAAGYYIGTVYTTPDGFTEPGSRDSDYFKSSGEAEEYLKRLKAGENLPLRGDP